MRHTIKRKNGSSGNRTLLRGIVCKLKTAHFTGVLGNILHEGGVLACEASTLD